MASGIRAVLHKIDPRTAGSVGQYDEAIIADTMTGRGRRPVCLAYFRNGARAYRHRQSMECLPAQWRSAHTRLNSDAMGAGETDVLWMVLRRTLLLAGSGVLIGTFWRAGRNTRADEVSVPKVTATDPSTFLAVTAILVIVALLSAWIPPSARLACTL